MTIWASAVISARLVMLEWWVTVDQRVYRKSVQLCCLAKVLPDVESLPVLCDSVIVVCMNHKLVGCLVPNDMQNGSDREWFPSDSLMNHQSPYLQWPKHANLEQLLEQTDVTCKSSVTGLVCWQFSCARPCQ